MLVVVVKIPLRRKTFPVQSLPHRHHVGGAKVLQGLDQSIKVNQGPARTRSVNFHAVILNRRDTLHDALIYVNSIERLVPYPTS